MSRKKEKYLYLVSIILLLSQLVFLLFLKYMNQGLSLGEFSLFKIGNLLNIIIYIGIICGIFITLKNNNNIFTKKLINKLVIFSWLMLLLGFIFNKISIVPKSFYLLNQSGDRIITGLFYFLFLLTLYYFLIYLWTIIKSSRRITASRTIYGATLMSVLLLLLTFIYIHNTGYNSLSWKLSKNKENYAVVLGAAVWTGNIPSPTLSSRVDRAIDLLKKGYAGKIVLTGGKAPGEMSESEVAFEYARVKGVDSSLIIIENYTSSTTDQIKWIKSTLLAKENFDAEIIIVSDRYHLPRVIEISKFFNFQIKVAESVHELSFEDKIYNLVRESIALFIFWNFAL